MTTPQLRRRHRPSLECVCVEAFTVPLGKAWGPPPQSKPCLDLPCLLAAFFRGPSVLQCGLSPRRACSPQRVPVVQPASAAQIAFRLALANTRPMKKLVLAADWGGNPLLGRRQVPSPGPNIYFDSRTSRSRSHCFTGRILNEHGQSHWRLDGKSPALITCAPPASA